MNTEDVFLTDGCPFHEHLGQLIRLCDEEGMYLPSFQIIYERTPQHEVHEDENIINAI